MMLRTSALRTLRPLRQTPLLARFYHEKVLDHYNRPRNVGSLPKNDIDVGTGLYFPHLSSLFPCHLSVIYVQLCDPAAFLSLPPSLPEGFQLTLVSAHQPAAM